MVQLREKDLSAAALLSLARQTRRMTAGRCLMIVNDRIDVALLSGADGVQLGEEGIDTASARRLLGNDLLIGRSVHSVERAIEAESDGTDFLVLGTVFETASHPGVETGGLGLVTAVARSVSIPTLGIGGITTSNVAGLIESGADGAAIVSAISMATDPAAAVECLLQRIREASARSRAQQ